MDILSRGVSGRRAARAAVLAAAGLGLATALPAGAQISPGELSEPHAFLEGVRKCLQCHDLGKGPSREKCLECHGEVAVRLREKRGYHHHVVNVGGESCFGCHREHAGRDFSLVYWPAGIGAFEHGETGYVLRGKHADAGCRACHRPDHVREDLVSLLEGIDLAATYLGLGRECLVCHADEHRGQLAPACEDCHDMDGWRPAPGFDHERARFKLRGKHAAVACSRCHAVERDPAARDREDATFARYTGVPFESCASCHDDAHRGRLGKNCERCHDTSGWRHVVARNFDHSKTQFPLRGHHAAVACKACHGEGSLLSIEKYSRCSDCHQDVHRGQFARRTDGGLCESCHSVDGFVPARFTLEDHRSARFALEGSHRAVPCTACHVQVETVGAPYRRFRFDEIRCESCHRDVHRGQFARTPPKKACSECHRVTRWREIDFAHDRDTSYPLVGAHRGVSCGGCHRVEREGKSSYVRYRGLDTRCESCHSGKVASLEKG
jgi:hypothetical protein